MFKFMMVLMISCGLFFVEIYAEEVDQKRDTMVMDDSLLFLIEDGEDYLRGLKKDVFETTIEFRQRREAEKDKIQTNILNKIKDKIDIAGSGTATMLEYDADSRLMSFDLNWLPFHKDFLTSLETKAFLDIEANEARKVFKTVKKHKFYVDVIYDEADRLVIDKAYILYQDKILNLFFKRKASSLEPIRRAEEFLIPLTVTVEQKNAKVMITNIKPKYYDGIELKEGKYTILIKKRGYASLKKTIYLGEKNHFNFSLKKLKRKKRLRYVPIHREINKASQYRNRTRNIGNGGWE